MIGTLTRQSFVAVTVGLACAALFGGAGTAGADEPTIEIGMAPQEITVGERVELEIAIEPRSGFQPPIFPDWASGGWGSTEILSAGEVERTSTTPGRWRYSQRLIVTAFEVGDLELPPISIELPRAGDDSITLRSDARMLHVRSVLPDEADAGEPPAPRPPADLRSIGPGRAFWWVVGALSLFTGLALVALLRRSGDIEVMRPRLEPLEEFDRLVRDLGTEKDAVAFHTRLSFALRHFLGRTLSFPAIESTTTEIQQRLREHQLAGETVRHTSQLLRDCDQVKFARVLAGRHTAAEILDETRKLVRSIDRDLRPETPEFGVAS